MASDMTGAERRAGMATCPSFSDTARPRPVTPVTSRWSDVMPVPPPSGATICGNHLVSVVPGTPGVSPNIVHVSDCRGIATGGIGGIISYCAQW